MCSWSLDMLAQPQETLDLQQRQSRAVAATCMAFPQPQSDINNLIVGSEEGTIYSGTSARSLAASVYRHLLNDPHLHSFLSFHGSFGASVTFFFCIARH